MLVDSPDIHQKISARALVDSPELSLSFMVNSSNVLWGFAGVQTAINRCSPTCLSCGGYLESDCTKCYSFAIKNSSYCSCIPGFYLVVLNPCDDWICSFCQLCDNQCKSCNAHYFNNCTDCYDGYSLINSTCIKNNEKNNFTIVNDLNYNNLNSNLLTTNFTITSTNQINNVTMNCSYTPKIFGGYKIFDMNTSISRNFNFSIQHHTIKISLKLFIFNSVAPNSKYSLIFDNSDIFEISLINFDVSSQFFCGIS